MWKILSFYTLLAVFSGQTGGYGYTEPYICDEYLSSNSGLITSPNFPFNYASSLSCLQRIYFQGFTSKNPKQICFTFYMFQLSYVDGCFDDYLDFPQLPGESGVVRYCGNGVANKNYLNETRNSVFSPNFCWPLESGRPFDLRFRSIATSSNQGYMAKYEILSVESEPCFENCFPEPCERNYFRCFDGGCIPKQQVCDWQKNCQDGSDEEYWYARCPVSLDIMACSFENDSCHFDGQDIFRNNTSPAGPRFDHTYLTYAAGNFLYFDGTGSSYLNYTMVPIVRTGDHCLSFWFFMSGYVGALSLYITDAQGRRALVAYRKDDHGMKWNQAEVDIPAEAFPLKELTFETSEGYMDINNIAIDDISLIQGNCNKSDVSCTFEMGFCGWKPPLVPQSDVSWTLKYDETLSEQFFPVNFEQMNFYKLYMDSSNCKENDQARLTSRSIINGFHTRFCLRFSYFFTEKSIGQLTVSILNGDGGITSIWVSRNAVPGKRWQEVAVLIMSGMGPFQIVFEGTCKAAYSSDIAVDNIELISGFCSNYLITRTAAPPRSVPPTGHPSGCEWDQYKCPFSGECILREKICDGRVDCSDQFDEKDCAFTGGELMPNNDHGYVANDVIIGVSVVCVAIFLTVVVIVVIAARRRSIVLRLARRRMMRQAANSVIHDSPDLFPTFYEPKPPPYDFSLPIAPSYAADPPPYASQSSDIDHPDAGLSPPSYETSQILKEPNRGRILTGSRGLGNNRDPERMVFNAGMNDLPIEPTTTRDTQGFRTTSI